MKRPIKEKLIAYSALAGTFCTTANSQIVYTDIDPDITINVDGEAFDLDLNGDLIKDFRFRKVLLSTDVNSFETLSGNVFPAVMYINNIYASALGVNAIAGELSPYSFNYPFALNEGDTICDNLSWQAGKSQSLAYSLRYLLDLGGGAFSNYIINDEGNWFGGKTDKFIGLQLKVGGDFLYGWARLDVSSGNDSLIIKDYAYNSVPGDCILANEPNYVPPDTTDTIDTSSFVINPLFKNISIYSYGNTVYIQTEDSHLIPETRIEIFAIEGKKIFVGKLENGAEIITLGNTANGIYIIQLIYADQTYQKKLFIENF